MTCYRQECYEKENALREEIGRLKVDAERYRWLRDKAIYIDQQQKILRIRNVYIKDRNITTSLNAALDAAMERKE